MTGEFIIVDFYGQHPKIVTDELGNVMYFDTKVSAEVFSQKHLEKDHYKVIETL